MLTFCKFCGGELKHNRCAKCWKCVECGDDVFGGDHKNVMTAFCSCVLDPLGVGRESSEHARARRKSLAEQQEVAGLYEDYEKEDARFFDELHDAAARDQGRDR